MKKEYNDCVTVLSEFATGAHRKLSEPLEVSFINVKLLIQDLEVSWFSGTESGKPILLCKERSVKLLRSSQELFPCLVGITVTCMHILISASHEKAI